MWDIILNPISKIVNIIMSEPSKNKTRLLLESSKFNPWSVRFDFLHSETAYIIGSGIDALYNSSYVISNVAGDTSLWS